MNTLWLLAIYECVSGTSLLRLFCRNKKRTVQPDGLVRFRLLVFAISAAQVQVRMDRIDLLLDLGLDVSQAGGEFV